MFDVGFSEMIVIAIIALVVLGPEKLPKVARTVGHLLGRMQRYVNDVKADINREIELDELRKLQQSMQETARSIEHTVKSEANAVESEFNKVAQSAQSAVSTDPAPGAAAPSVPHTTYPENPVGEPAAASSSSVTTAAASPQLELGLDPAAAPSSTPAAHNASASKQT